MPKPTPEEPRSEDKSGIQDSKETPRPQKAQVKRLNKRRRENAERERENNLSPSSEEAVE
jgi:hypothetical protein